MAWSSPKNKAISYSSKKLSKLQVESLRRRPHLWHHNQSVEHQKQCPLLCIHEYGGPSVCCLHHFIKGLEHPWILVSMGQGGSFGTNPLWIPKDDYKAKNSKAITGKEQITLMEQLEGKQLIFHKKRWKWLAPLKLKGKIKFYI